MRTTAAPYDNISTTTGRYPEGMPSTWTFKRGDQRLVLQRHDDQEGLTLVITTEDGSRSIPFSEFGALVTFQMNMEQFLVRTGWSLATFAPDHRRYQDRRLFPRVHADRRRWWTDSHVPVAPTNWLDTNRR
jgi:hypothetical protein